MLVQLLASQILQWWPLFAPHIESTLPPFAYGDADRMLNIKTSLLSGEMLCWVLQGEADDGSSIPFGFVLTTISTDSCSGVRNVILYCVYGYKKIPVTLWLSAWETLKAYAKGMLCHRIVAYTDVPHIVDIALELGMSAQYTFLTYEVV